MLLRLLHTQILTDIAVHGIEMDVPGVEFCTPILVKIVPCMAENQPNNGSFWAFCPEAIIG